ncbi:MAG: hypothetical protein HQK73_01470 [Desulfamplus sp.]|nr:hypothetical protein [Desulfamplus sp.]MBF0412830.1 hypothetical protein [Desulfamplus sp.]
MKRFTILFIAVVCAVMFIAPVYADDRVNLSGEFRVRGWDISSQNYTNNADSSYFDQRLRMGTKINVADNVSIQLRADWGEGVWGSDYTGGGFVNDGAIVAGSAARPRKAFTNTIDVDRAFVDIKQEWWSLRAGQQYMGLGVNQVLDANATGFKFDLNFAPVVTSVLYAKISEDTGLIDDNDVKVDSEDQDFYALNVNYTCDAFTGNVFVAGLNDGTDTDNSPIMAGIQGSAKLGAITLLSELDFATGDTNDGDTDYMGTQFFLGGYADVAAGVNIGAELVYALGADPDDNEMQYSYFNKWGDTFGPMDMNTPFAGELNGYCFVDVFDPFEILQDSSGVQGILFQAKYSPMDIFSLGAKFAYLQPEEDIVVNTIDADASAISCNVWMKYTIATNTELWLTYLYTDIDVDDSLDLQLEAQKVLVSQLAIKF